MSTALAVRGETNGASTITGDQIEAIEAMLPAAIEAEAMDELLELTQKAQAAELYERRRGYGAQADRLVRLKIRAEAALGIVDMRGDSPRSGERNALAIGGVVIAAATRKRWRSLGVAMERNLLNVVFDQLQDDPSTEISGHTVRTALAMVGSNHVPDNVLAGPVHAAMEQRKISPRQVAREAGIADTSIYRLIGRAHSATAHRHMRMEWRTAKRLAGVVGVDPQTLPPAPLPSTAGKRRRDTVAARRALERERRSRNLKGPSKAAYAHLRSAAQALQQVADEAGTDARRLQAEGMLHHVYDVLDAVLAWGD